jgi:hypothetical protein
MGRGQALGVLLQALAAEELGTDRFFQRGRTVDNGGGGPQLWLPSRDVERMLPFPDPRRFGISGLDRLEASSWTLPWLPATVVISGQVGAHRTLVF